MNNNQLNQEELEFRLYVSRLVGEITHLATLIDLTTDLTTGIDYAGHVDQFTLNLAENREDFRNYKGKTNISSELYVAGWSADTKEAKEHKISRLLKMKRKLKNILRDKGIDYGKLDYTIETVEYKKYVI